jgi:DNA-binding NarL/FixJ family response regulator
VAGSGRTGSDAAHTRRPLRVAVVGGRTLGRCGLHALLEAEPGITVTSQCADELSARAAVRDGDVDVVVTHVFLGTPGGGARLAERLHRDAPTVGVVVLLGESDPSEVRSVLERGTARRALLLLDHPRCASDLVRAIEEVAEGGSFIHDGVVDLLLRREQLTAADQVHLTPREAQVLDGIARGASNRRIAATLSASERAIEKHIHQLYAKLQIPAVDGVHRRVLAARRAFGLPAACLPPEDGSTDPAWTAPAAGRSPGGAELR